MVGISATRVVVVGQGYVGLPLAMRAVEVGYTVVGYDVDAGRVKSLAAGESYVDDITDDVLTAALKSGRYHPSSAGRDCADFDVAIITVPTPLAEGTPDLSYITQCAKTLAPYVRPGTVVVLESTTYPGSTEELLGPLLEAGSGLLPGKDFHLGYSPERIDSGNTVWTLRTTPKLVSGIDEQSADAVRAFYDTIVDETIAVSGTREAELAKLLENTFRHVNIALVNELGMFGSDLGINVSESIDAASTKPFGFMRFTPGPGVGGHCLPIDPSYLSWRVKRQLGRPFRFVELANDVNEHMPDYVVKRLMVALNRQGKACRNSRLLLLGLSYKRNTGDVRESPSMRVAAQLVELEAKVAAVDPHVAANRPELNIDLVDLTASELASADGVVLLVDHDAFDFEFVVQHARYVLDTRGCLPDGPTVERLY